MNRLKTYLLLGLSFGVAVPGAIAQKIQVKWDFAKDYHPESNRVLQLTLKNIDQKAIQLSDYSMWFTSNYPIENIKGGSQEFQDHNGNLFSMEFKPGTLLKLKDSLVLTYQSPYPITHTSLSPNGFYLQRKDNPKVVVDLGHPEVGSLQVSKADQLAFLSALYAKNTRTRRAKPQQILPTPSAVEWGSGQIDMGQQWATFIDPKFSTSDKQRIDRNLQEFMQVTFVESAEEASKFQIMLKQGLGAEDYELAIDKNGIRIQASETAGVFYALQTLKSLSKPDVFAGKSSPVFQYLEVKDSPRYAYRGFMMDIARNFKDIHVLKKYVDLMSLYKLNKFHLHFIDDEGWRLEIPSLPELTEIGSQRSAWFKDGQSLQPAYGSGVQSGEKSYLSKAEFQELLRYAADRHVTIIPEIESPGHGRAAIKAMETRCNRLMKQGKKKEAEEFLLYEAADKSIYNSAQNWKDNVWNPALPSVYRFVDVVLDDIKQMYEEVGLKLELVSLGGDEVPAGSWEGSPAVQQLMQKEGMQTVYEVWPYYVSKIYEICASKGMAMAGWEEFGMINKGSGMVVNEQLTHLNLYLDVWNNVIGGGHEDLAYKLANAGYKTVFTSAANYYIDMVWDKDFREPGLKWASITDLYQSFSLLPEAFFANMKYTEAGKNLQDDYLAKKVRLTEKGKSNLVGLKAALWAETVLTADRIDYMVLPRLFAVAERSWAPKRNWEDDQHFDEEAFDEAYRSFVSKVGAEELQKMDSFHGGFQYRLPSVGLMVQKGTLRANTEYPGFDIRYSLDGTEPTASSPLFPAVGFGVSNGMVVKVASSSATGRIGRVSTYYR